MGKVSIGLRGWRFDEEAVFDDDGRLRPLDDLPPDTKRRLVRLRQLVEAPCDACWLAHGRGSPEDCNPAQVVYGEPLAEVVLCDDHEPDFLYWFFECGGREYKGEEELEAAFQEWFADGGRAPDDYEGIEHVETAPEELPDPPDPKEVVEEQTGETTDRIDIEDELDLSEDYPT